MLLHSNSEWLQWQIADILENVPALFSAPLIAFSKRKYGVDKENLWKFVPWALGQMSDDEFDRHYDRIMTLLREL